MAQIPIAWQKDRTYHEETGRGINPPSSVSAIRLIQYQELFMTLSTYINFAGNCREAFEFYRSVFGGEFAVMETFRNGPPDM